MQDGDLRVHQVPDHNIFSWVVTLQFSQVFVAKMI